MRAAGTQVRKRWAGPFLSYSSTRRSGIATNFGPGRSAGPPPVVKIRDGKLRYSELRTDQEIFNEYAKAAVVTGHSARRYAEAVKPFSLL